MPLDLTDDKSTLVQVMAWCRQATCHYLSQCWPRSMSSNGVTRPQWVNNHPEHIWDQKLIYLTISSRPPHYSEITWASWHLESTVDWLFVQQPIKASDKETNTAPYYWSFMMRIHPIPVTCIDKMTVFNMTQKMDWQDVTTNFRTLKVNGFWRWVWNIPSKLVQYHLGYIMLNWWQESLVSICLFNHLSTLKNWSRW